MYYEYINIFKIFKFNNIKLETITHKFTPTPLSDSLTPPPAASGANKDVPSTPSAIQCEAGLSNLPHCSPSLSMLNYSSSARSSAQSLQFSEYAKFDMLSAFRHTYYVHSHTHERSYNLAGGGGLKPPPPVFF